MLRIALSCCLVAALGCGDKTTVGLSEAKVAKGQGYEFAVPGGYAVALAKEFQPIVDTGGVVLARTAGADNTKFRGSVVVAPVDGDLGGDPADVAFCNKTANDFAGALRTELLSASVVDTPIGKTCQWEVRSRDGDAVHQATGTIMTAGAAAYVVTCNYDPSDIKAQEGCKQVIGGWKVTSPAP